MIIGRKHKQYNENNDDNNSLHRRFKFTSCLLILPLYQSICMLIWNSKRDFKSILLYVVCTVRCLFVPAIEKYAFECVFERFPKVAIEVGIDQWVQH